MRAPSPCLTFCLSSLIVSPIQGTLGFPDGFAHRLVGKIRIAFFLRVAVRRHPPPTQCPGAPWLPAIPLV